MKKIIIFTAVFSVFALISCNKNKCAQCHYYNDIGAEFELGEFCGDDIENIEKNGYTLDGVTYSTHCGEH